jgi:hypothetical protein
MFQRKPVHEIKLGAIRAAVWENHAGQTDVWFNVTVSRLYKTGTTWGQSNAFRRDDLPLAIKAMEMAYAWIWEHQAASHSENTSAPHANAYSTSPLAKEVANGTARP